MGTGAKTAGRNSSIELLKIFAILLIVTSHVIQTLHTPNTLVGVQDYVLDLSRATTNIQYLILSILRDCGSLGNTIFFVCSAWFLTGSDIVNKKKILQMILDIFTVSVIILLIVFVIKGGKIGARMIIRQLLPTTYANNWYLTCYLLFYAIHPALNCVIKNMPQRKLLRSSLILLFLYVFVNYLIVDVFFTSSLVLWVALYFAIAYIKFYLPDISNSLKVNGILLAGGLLAHFAIILLTDFLGLRMGAFSNKLLHWNMNCNPFVIIAAIALLNIARNIHFENRIINDLSKLSLLIYIIHENMLLKEFYRPLLWQWVYSHYGYDHILVWMLILVVIVFAFAVTASVIYRATLQKLVAVMTAKVYPLLQRIYGRISDKILSLH